MNKFPLVYIPHCSEWVEEYEIGKIEEDKKISGAKYFLKKFQLLNSDILKDFMEKLKGAIDGNENPLEVYNEILKMKNLVN